MPTPQELGSAKADLAPGAPTIIVVDYAPLTQFSVFVQDWSSDVLPPEGGSKGRDMHRKCQAFCGPPLTIVAEVGTMGALYSVCPAGGCHVNACCLSGSTHPD